MNQMKMEKYIHTRTGRIILSILLGLGVASLFRSVCKGKNCMVFYAAPMEEINNKVHKYDNKCYKYVSTVTKCDKSKKIVEFE
jgi:hypothetical protein